MVAFLSDILFLHGVGGHPYLRETNAGMEPEEDGERDAEVRNDAPREVSIVLCVQRHCLGLLRLKGSNTPQRQVA